MSPIFTVIVSSLVPLPTAITVPFCCFSFAESGIISPDAVVVSAYKGFIKTLSANGLILILLILF